MRRVGAISQGVVKTMVFTMGGKLLGFSQFTQPYLLVLKVLYLGVAGVLGARAVLP